MTSNRYISNINIGDYMNNFFAKTIDDTLEELSSDKLRIECILMIDYEEYKIALEELRFDFIYPDVRNLSED